MNNLPNKLIKFLTDNPEFREESNQFVVYVNKAKEDKYEHYDFDDENVYVMVSKLLRTGAQELIFATQRFDEDKKITILPFIYFPNHPKIKVGVINPDNNYVIDWDDKGWTKQILKEWAYYAEQPLHSSKSK